MLMEQIEPDLTSVRVEALDFVYAGESEEQHAARMARYEKAFALLDERVKTLFGAWQKEIQDYKRAFIQKKIAPSQAEDAKVMSDISTSIDSI